MPLPELLALYGFRAGSQKTETSIDDDADRSEPMEEQESSETDPPDQGSQLQTLYDALQDGDQDASRLLRCKWIFEHFLEINFILQQFLGLVRRKMKITITVPMKMNGERSIRLLSLLITHFQLFIFIFFNGVK